MDKQDKQYIGKMKRCTSCHKIKPTSNFYTQGKYLRPFCKVCYRKYNKKYVKTYKKRNPGKHAIYMRRYRKKYPWVKPYRAALERCTNKNCHKYRRYGRRGIKFMLTMEEIKTLWFRDKAYTLEVPSIDRINNEGHYEYSNCRFIERHENSRKGAK